VIIKSITVAATASAISDRFGYFQQGSAAIIASFCVRRLPDHPQPWEHVHPFFSFPFVQPFPFLLNPLLFS